MIALRNEFLNFSRKADAKIGLLKEVIKRVQRGEDVDVEGLLGTGDSEKEKEWEDVLREIEHEDALWQSGSQKHKNKRSMTQNKGIDTKEHIECEEKPASTIKAVEATSATKGPPRFY
ncbi:MAG: hypothetical protein M1836_000405 [Candelina mexicana]|nr:MAG: hypothetical protein M1836_000405 [Candelina mexicana]